MVRAACRLNPGVLTGLDLKGELIMAYTSLLQIFKLDEPRKWSKNGREGVIQTAQCALLTDEGAIEQVGVLDIPEALREQAKKPGVYRGGFALQARQYGDQRGRIEAVLTSLTEVPPAKPVAAKA